MRPPSRETQQSLDSLNNELKMIMATLGQEKVSEDAKAKAHARLAELTDQIVNISKSGDAPEYIINLTGKRWIVNRSYSSFWIPGRKNGELYSSTKINGRDAVIDTGRGGEVSGPGQGWRVKLDKLYYTAHQIALDIEKEINSDLPAMFATSTQSLESSQSKIKKTMGVFISTTAVPDQALLRDNLKVLLTFCAALVNEGNAVWSKTKDYRQISDLYRFGADYLDISTEWHQSLTAVVSEVLEDRMNQLVPAGAVEQRSAKR